MPPGLEQGESADGLALHYSSVADDGSAGSKSREAAMLFAVAETHVMQEEDHDEAMKCATVALTLFQEAGDFRGEGDTLRLMLSAFRCKAQLVRYVSLQDRTNVLTEAEAFALTALEKCRAKGSSYGEASMLLGLSEVLCMTEKPDEAFVGGIDHFRRKEVKGVGSFGRRSRSNVKKGLDMLELGSKAAAIFHELGETRMEIFALLTNIAFFICQGASQEALSAVEQALPLCQATGDKRSEARALHSKAVAISQGPQTKASFEEGAQAAKAALLIHKELGLKKMHAWEANFLAKWYLMMERPRDALPHAKESMQIFHEIDYGKGWQPESTSTLCKVLVALGEVKKALKLARQQVERYRLEGNKRCHVLALDNLISTLLEGESKCAPGDINEAMESAEEGARVCVDLEDRK